MAGIGGTITGLAMKTVTATFDTQNALGELSSLGVKDLKAVEDAAKSFSNTWAGTSKADFITASYDIKSGIASLTDEGVAQFTQLAALTGKATKSTTEEMGSLFATGYGIYKGFYDDMSDLEFGEMFSAGIATAVKNYKTSGIRFCFKTMSFCYLKSIVVFTPVYAHITSCCLCLLLLFGIVGSLNLQPVSFSMFDEASIHDSTGKLFQLYVYGHKHPAKVIEDAALFEVRYRKAFTLKLSLYLFHLLIFIRERDNLLHNALIYHSTITSTPLLSMSMLYSLLLSVLRKAILIWYI